MIDHIQTEMQHFAGRIQAWDVVNFSGIDPEAMGLPNGLRKRRRGWSLVGDDYIDLGLQNGAAGRS